MWTAPQFIQNKLISLANEMDVYNTIADFLGTARTPFQSWIYTLQLHDLDTFWAFDTSGANDQLINLI